MQCYLGGFVLRDSLGFDGVEGGNELLGTIGTVVHTRHWGSVNVQSIGQLETWIAGVGS